MDEETKAKVKLRIGELERSLTARLAHARALQEQIVEVGQQIERHQGAIAELAALLPKPKEEGQPDEAPVESQADPNPKAC